MLSLTVQSYAFAATGPALMRAAAPAVSVQMGVADMYAAPRGSSARKASLSTNGSRAARRRARRRRPGR